MSYLKFIEILESYDSNNQFVHTVRSDPTTVYNHSYYFPEFHFQGKLPNSIIKVLSHNELSGTTIPYWYITLAVKYNKVGKLLQVKAIEHVTEDDKDYHLQRICVFQRYVDGQQRTLCVHKNNMFVNHVTKTEIPCGMSLDLYSHGGMNTTFGLYLGKFSSWQDATHSVFNMAYLPSLSVIPTQSELNLLEGKAIDTVIRQIEGDTQISQEHAFSVDTKIIKIMFSQIFGRGKTLELNPLIVRGLCTDSKTDWRQTVFALIHKLPLITESVYGFLAKTKDGFLINFTGSILPMLDFDDVLDLRRVAKLKLDVDKMDMQKSMNNALSANDIVEEAEPSMIGFFGKNRAGLFSDISVCKEEKSGFKEKLSLQLN